MVMMKHNALTDDPIFRLIYSRINLVKKNKMNEWLNMNVNRPINNV